MAGLLQSLNLSYTVIVMGWVLQKTPCKLKFKIMNPVRPPDVILTCSEG